MQPILVQEDGATTESGTQLPTEAEMTQEIIALCAKREDGRLAIKRTREEEKALRLQLGERLYQVKTIRAHTGRGGQWTQYLRSVHLSRASADRWVAQYEDTLKSPKEKRLSEAISDESEDPITRLARQLARKLMKTLLTRESQCRLVHELVVEMIDGGAGLTEDGIRFSLSGPSPKRGTRRSIVHAETTAIQ